MTNAALLHVERLDDVALLTLDRPQKRNALNNQFIDELNAFFAAPPDGARVVVLQASGDHFCAGLDLIEMLESRKTDSNVIVDQRRSRAWHRTFDLIQFGEIPVVSVLKGATFGGGLELASATHVRVAERSARFQLPEGQRGIFVGGSGSVRIPRLIGAGRMVEMMLTGRTLDADEGLRLGLAHYVVNDGEGLAKALELAAQIAGNSPVSNYAVINGVARIAEMGFDEGLFAETVTASMTGADAEKRIQHFFQQRRQQGADNA